MYLNWEISQIQEGGLAAGWPRGVTHVHNTLSWRHLGKTVSSWKPGTGFFCLQRNWVFCPQSPPGTVSGPEEGEGRMFAERMQLCELGSDAADVIRGAREPQQSSGQ